jgi:uncharacterized protein YndB with AHSA1/START domain
MPTTGTYEERNGQPVVRFERTFPYPVKAVWEAITDPAELAAWFPTTVEFDHLAPGVTIAFRFENDAYPPMSGEVLEVVPSRRLEFTWGPDRLTFELEPIEHGAACRLSFSVALDSAGKAARDSAGWEQCLDTLEVVVSGGTVKRPMASEVWREYYDQYRRLGLPASAPLPD